MTDTAVAMSVTTEEICPYGPVVVVVVVAGEASDGDAAVALGIESPIFER